MGALSVFLYSFGAAVVCRTLGRRYYMAGIDKVCVNIGGKRVQEAVG